MYLLYFMIHQKKCEQYWNDNMDCPLEPGRNMSVMVTSIMEYANCVIREITLANVSKAKSNMFEHLRI